MTNSPPKVIGLVLKPKLLEVQKELGTIFSWARDNKCEVAVQVSTLAVLENIDSAFGTKYSTVSKVDSLSDLICKCDLIITLGGDGTLISVARLFDGKSTAVMLGVNFGTLGYLTEVKASELATVLPLVTSGQAPIQLRSMLIGEVFDSIGNIVFSSAALNDVVVVKGANERLLKMEIRVDGQPLAEFRGDGLVIATPTGSTAYSLAAGGSIVYPSVPVTLLTPICPHSLTMRPLILPSEQVIEISIPDSEGVLVTADGQQTHHLSHGEVIKVTQAPFQVPLVRSPNRSYFDVLKTKLNWGIPNRAD